MSDAPVAVLEILAVPLALLTVVWVLLGRPARVQERADERRRRGGRRPGQGRWMPARDRALGPYALLAVLAATDLAQVVVLAGDAWHRTTRTALLLGAVVAAGFGIRPDLVGSGLGLLGSVVLLMERLGGLGCPEEVPLGLTVLWAVLSLGLVALVTALRIVVLPVRSATRVVVGVSRPFLTSPGSEHPLGPTTQTLLVLFGVLSVLDLALRPAASPSCCPMASTSSAWSSSASPPPRSSPPSPSCPNSRPRCWGWSSG